ncbi:6-phosphogluconolactonase [Carboxylicivirga linearis]|uniref:6-phosphogluconolactonase n=1 Tax=Carboxylicivirga linearis TaxID=1628157 RepID=A0ABS5JVF0_9BACT|nr:6-phosphogluconolactonase [Carboxylicivirga linearis]MBS2098879.1 6-phosphogluconolactonase [Carboxylicivirga linearis]
MKANTQIFESKEAIARYLAENIKEQLQQKDELYIALSGGSTPKAIFKVWAQEYAKDIDWASIKFFWGDERCVPPDDIESNFGMTKEYLFDHVGTKGINIFRVKGELSEEKALEDYITCIEENVPFENNLPQFDIMLLGMGDDGHTASIFPHQINLWDEDTVCTLAKHPESGQTRVSLTGKTINNSQRIFFLVTGSNKAEKVNEIINKKEQYNSYPASLVSTNQLTWLLDKEAASELL